MLLLGWLKSKSTKKKYEHATLSTMPPTVADSPKPLGSFKFESEKSKVIGGSFKFESKKSNYEYFRSSGG